MKTLQALVVGALLLAPATAESQTVVGVVVEDETEEPITGVSVELLGPDAASAARARTDEAGLFLLRAPRSGSFVIRLTHPSYAAVESDPLDVGADETVELELRMGRAAIALEPVVITARSTGRLAGFYDRLERPGFGRFIVRSDIERRPGASTTDLLRSLPGVHIVRAARTEDNVITMRLGQCVPSVYIDGVHLRQFAGGGIDRYLRPDMIEGVEVYTGIAGVPPQFAANGCGVVAFWTRAADAPASGGWSWRRLVTGGAVLAVMGVLVTLVR